MKIIKNHEAVLCRYCAAVLVASMQETKDLAMCKIIDNFLKLLIISKFNMYFDPDLAFFWTINFQSLDKC